MKLTSEQQAIINLGFEHCVITAVAGSGKTTTLACRIQRLLASGHAPERILILMFNRSAKEDFEKKLQKLCRGQQLKLPEIRTYHAMGYRLYQRFIKEGYLAQINPKVLSEQEVQYQLWNMIRTLAPRDLQDEIKRNKKEHVETASHFIELVKSSLASPQEVFEELDYPDKSRFLLMLFDHFEQWRKDHARITFADMLYEPVKLIHEKPELQALVTNKMDMVLVDEYQDTNEIQHRLLKYIAGQRARVTVVGDPDQTIYEFRGARPEYILNRFTEEFESPHELTLTNTFRYGHRVALLANHLISHNKGRKDVLCHSHPSVGDTKIHLHEEETGACIVRLLQKHQQRHSDLNDVAVLCRVWSQTVPIELALLSQLIPYQIDNGKGALATREIVALVYLLEYASGRFSELSVESRRLRFSALLRFPHTGLSEDKVQQLSDVLSRQTGSWPSVLLSCLEEGYHPMQKRKLRALSEALQMVAQYPGNATHALHKYTTQTGLYEGIRSLALTHDSAEEKVGIVKGFLKYIRELDVNCKDSLSHIDSLKDRARQMKKSSGVLLTTIHRTKGLEWPVVIVPGLIEKYLPYTLREKEVTASVIESERRLLYVAMTRTVNELHLVTLPLAKASDKKRQRERTDKDTPSRFISELQFTLSESIGGHLKKLTATLSDKTQDNDQDGQQNKVFEASQPMTPIAKRYCDLEGLTYTAPEVTESEEDEEKIIWSLARVRHAIFGVGNITSESETSFKVNFDDGQTMDFSKKSAHLYFSEV